MAKTILGGLVGGVVLFLVGYVFWGLLSGLAFSSLPDAQTAGLRAALAQTLTQGGTGTYLIPDPRSSAAGATLYGQGPIATVHFNTAGFANPDPTALISGFILALVTGLLIAFALRLADRVPDAIDRVKIAILFALATTLYIHIGQPIMNHHGWGYFLFSFFADFIGLAAAGVVIAKWFGPKLVAERPLS